MRIYKVSVEHKEHGRNWSRFNVAGRNFEEALKRARQRLPKDEVIESMELIAEAD